MTACEAAAYLRVAHRTVLFWAKTGRIPAHKLSGAQRVTWRFRADELDEFMSHRRLNEQCIESASAHPGLP